MTSNVRGFSEQNLYNISNRIDRYNIAKGCTILFGSILNVGAAGIPLIDKTGPAGVKSALLVGIIGAGIVAGLWKFFDHKECKAHEQLHRQLTHDQLTQSFCSKGSEGGGRITYNEQCMLDEIIESKSSIFSQYSPKSEERYELENFYNNLIDEFTSPESEGGEMLTYNEQCQLSELSANRVRMMKES